MYKVMEKEEMELRVKVLRESTDMSVDDCIAQVEKIKELYDALSKGVVKFMFRKKDGTLRHAVGTVVHDMIKYEFKGTGKPSPSVLNYWDMEKEAFRSFNIASYIGMED